MKVHELFAYLRVRNATSAIDFYTRAFGATESFRLTEPSGRIGHAELRFGGATVMLSDEYPEMGILAPAAGDRAAMSLHLHVDDCDAWIARAVEAGATLVRPAQDHFYGERSGAVRDPFGHEWMLGHEIEKVTPEEMQARFTKMLGG